MKYNINNKLTRITKTKLNKKYFDASVPGGKIFKILTKIVV